MLLECCKVMSEITFWQHCDNVFVMPISLIYQNVCITLQKNVFNFLHAIENILEWAFSNDRGHKCVLS